MWAANWYDVSGVNALESFSIELDPDTDITLDDDVVIVTQEIEDVVVSIDPDISIEVDP